MSWSSANAFPFNSFFGLFKAHNTFVKVRSKNTWCSISRSFQSLWQLTRSFHMVLNILNFSSKSISVTSSRRRHRWFWVVYWYHGCLLLVCLREDRLIVILLDYRNHLMGIRSHWLIVSLLVIFNWDLIPRVWWVNRGLVMDVLRDIDVLSVCVSQIR